MSPIDICKPIRETLGERWARGCLIFILLMLLTAVFGIAPVGATSVPVNLTLNWSPENGLYTRWWFDPESDFIDVYGFFYGIFLPITSIIGNLFYFVIWSVIVMGLYLYTQGTEIPFVVGVLSGALMSTAMGGDALMVITLTMAFCAGGILTKVLLGRT